MAETVAGIELPPGEPGAVRDAAQKLRGVGAGFERVGSTVSAAATSVSWSGTASSAFYATTGDLADAANKVGSGSERAASVLGTFADRLEQARERVRTLQRKAEDELQKMEDARKRAGELRTEASQARDSASVSTGGDLGGASIVAREAYMQQAGDLETQAAAQDRIADAAHDELERLRREAETERDDVEQAASEAAGQMGGAEDMLPVLSGTTMLGSQAQVEQRVLQGVRAGDFSVMDGVYMGSLSEDTQHALGEETAEHASEAAAGDGDESISEISEFSDRFDHDEQFSTGFYAHLGGDGTRELALNLLDGHGDDFDDEGGLDGETAALVAPFATMLGTATRSGQLSRLSSGFTEKFLGRDGETEEEDRFGAHTELAAFVMQGDGDNYSPEFLRDVGEEVLIMPDRVTSHSEGVHYEDDFMRFMADNPNASALLLVGSAPDLEGDATNLDVLFGRTDLGTAYSISTLQYDDHGESLGAMIQAGTQDLGSDDRRAGLHSGDVELANQASHAVIAAAPGMAEQNTWGTNAVPTGLRESLTGLLETQIGGFDHAAATQAFPEGGFDRGNSAALTYDEASEYTQMLLADEDSREETTRIIGAQVAHDFYDATGHSPGSDERTDGLRRGGALQQMATESSIDDSLETAERIQASNEMAKTIYGEAIGAAIRSPIPGTGAVIGEGLDRLIPTDQVEQALRQARGTDLESEELVNHLIVAAEIQHGQLPVEALVAHPDNYDFVNGGDGLESDRDTFTPHYLVGDSGGRPMSEQDLVNLIAERRDEGAAQDAMREIQKHEHGDE